MFPSPLFTFASYLYSRATGTPPFIRYLVGIYILFFSIPALLGAGGPYVQIFTSIFVVYIAYNLRKGMD